MTLDKFMMSICIPQERIIYYKVKKIIRHKNIPIQTYDKSGWNMLLDDINLGYYPNLIFILTSNIPPHTINNMDPSYLRNKRINLIFELTN